MRRGREVELGVTARGVKDGQGQELKQAQGQAWQEQAQKSGPSTAAGVECIEQPGSSGSSWLK